MAENATISGGAATARTKESEESTVRDEARNAGEKAAAAVAESLAQLEPRPRKARATAVEDVAGTLDAIVEGVRPASAEGESATEPHRRTSKKASGAAKASESKKKAGEAKSGDAPEEGSGLRFSSAEEPPNAQIPAVNMTALLFQEPDTSRVRTRRRSRGEDASSSPSRRRKATGGETSEEPQEASSQPPAGSGESGQDAVGEREPRRRRRGSRGRRKGAETPETPSGGEESQSEAPREEAGGTRRRRRRARSAQAAGGDGVTTPKGSTRLEAKRQRRKEGREAGRRRHVITESEYLARRESVKREMLIREQDGLNQIAVLEDDVLVEHYVARHTQVSMVGNVYLGRVQNVLPSMEAAFVDIGKGRNAVLYAGEVNWEAAGLEGKPRRIEQALKSGDVIMVQVTKDPIGHKGARLTAQITLAGRHLVLVPSGAMTGISRKLPDKERQRLKRLLRELIPSEHGVIVRTAAEGASEEQLRADVERLTKTWEDIRAKAKNVKSAPTLLKGEPELAVRVVRDVFNEDFLSLRIQGAGAWKTISGYVRELSPELTERLEHWTGATDIFVKYRVDEQLAKAFDRKVWLPSGGTLIIDRTEAMTVIDVNTGKFTGSGGNLEETVTKNNLEAAEEIVRQMRLRDLGGMIVVDFIDMVLPENQDLVLRRLTEALGRDRTRHQISEVTSLGLVQITRKRLGTGLLETFATECEECSGRGVLIHDDPVEHHTISDRPERRGKHGVPHQDPTRHPAVLAMEHQDESDEPEPTDDFAEEPLFRPSETSIEGLAAAVVAPSAEDYLPATYEEAVSAYEASPRRNRKVRGNSLSDVPPQKSDFEPPIPEPEPEPEPESGSRRRRRAVHKKVTESEAAPAVDVDKLEETTHRTRKRRRVVRKTGSTATRRGATTQSRRSAASGKTSTDSATNLRGRGRRRAVRRSLK